jgi:hypothetical protein
MPTLHDLMSASINARAAALGAASLTATDASPADATRGLIARRRRRNAAVAGGSSALALGGLVAAGLLQDSRDQAPASADPNAIEYVKVEMSGTGGLQGFSDPVASVSCGATLPAPKTEDQEFTQSVAVDPTAPDGTLRVNASLHYDGLDRAPAYISAGYAVLTRDGVVVNEYPNNTTGDPFGAVTSGETWNANRVVDGSVFEQQPCRSGVYVEPSPNDVAYPAGDYLVYVTSQALVSAPVLAERELQDRGYYVAVSSQGAWNPGSVDCQQAVTSAGGGGTPVQCLDSLPSGVSIDKKANTTTLPYHAANYSGELNVTLVSQPIAVTLDHDITYADLGYASAPTSQPTSNQPLTCGQVDGTQIFGSNLDTTFAQPVTLASLVAGGEVPILVDARTRDERSRGTLRLADGAIASVVLGDSSSGAWVAAQGSAALAPSVVTIDRAKGYPDVSLKLDGMTECPAPTEGPWTVRQLDSPTIGVWLVVQGDLRIDWEDGTTTTANSITLSRNPPG